MTIQEKLAILRPLAYDKREVCYNERKNHACKANRKSLRRRCQSHFQFSQCLRPFVAGISKYQLGGLLYMDQRPPGTGAFPG